MEKLFADTGIDNPILFILIGLGAGYVAGKIMSKSERRLGLVVSLTIGVLGSLLAGWICKILNLSINEHWYGQFLQGLLGSILIFWVINKLRK